MPLRKLAAWIDLHGRPRPSRILADAVRIYSVELVNGESLIVANDVRSLGEARAVLGY